MILSVIAIIITAISIFVTISNSKSKEQRQNKLVYTPIESFNIFNKFSNGFDGFDIKYKSESISKSIVYISGVLACIGHDINSRNNHINIQIPKECKFKDLTLEKSNDEIVASAEKVTTDESKAILKFDNLRKNESITISAILETEQIYTKNQIENIHNNIEFRHRIIDTDDIKIETIHNSENNLSNLEIKSLVTMLLSSFALLTMYNKDIFLPGSQNLNLSPIMIAIIVIFNGIQFYSGIFKRSSKSIK